MENKDRRNTWYLSAHRLREKMRCWLERNEQILLCDCKIRAESFGVDTGDGTEAREGDDEGKAGNTIHEVLALAEAMYGNVQ